MQSTCENTCEETVAAASMMLIAIETKMMSVNQIVEGKKVTEICLFKNKKKNGGSLPMICLSIHWHNRTPSAWPIICQCSFIVAIPVDDFVFAIVVVVVAAVVVVVYLSWRTELVRACT